MADMEVYQYIVNGGVVIIFAVYNTVLMKYFLKYLENERKHRAKLVEGALMTINRLSDNIEEVLGIVKSQAEKK